MGLCCVVVKKGLRFKTALVLRFGLASTVRSLLRQSIILFYCFFIFTADQFFSFSLICRQHFYASKNIHELNQSIILFLLKPANIANKFDSSEQKKDTMAKRYALIHALEKNLVKI